MQFKTLPQLVQDHIQATASLAHDPAAALQNNQQLQRRISDRMASDPALFAFTTHFSQALAFTLRAIPPELQTSTIQYLLIQVVTEWEDLNLTFDKQLKASSQ